LKIAILWLLRVYAYLFTLALCIFLLAVAFFGTGGGGSSIKLGMLPWEGAALLRAIIALGAIGILLTAFAVAGFARWLFPLWSLMILILMVRGFFLSNYSFADASQFKFAVWLTAGALIAFLGSLSLFGRQRKTMKR